MGRNRFRSIWPFQYLPRWRDKKISGQEASFDAAFGVIGFIGLPGMVISATYFLVAKPLNNYAEEMKQEMSGF